MLRRRWQRVEKQEATRLGGRVQPGSGNQWHAKGDVKNDTTLAQVKSTEKKQFILKLADLEQIEQEAWKHNREPEFILVFLTTTGSRRYRILRDYGPAAEVPSPRGTDR